MAPNYSGSHDSEGAESNRSRHDPFLLWPLELWPDLIDRENYPSLVGFTTFFELGILQRLSEDTLEKLEARHDALHERYLRLLKTRGVGELFAIQDHLRSRVRSECIHLEDVAERLFSVVSLSKLQEEYERRVEELKSERKPPPGFVTHVDWSPGGWLSSPYFDLTFGSKVAKEAEFISYRWLQISLTLGILRHLLWITWTYSVGREVDEIGLDEGKTWEKLLYASKDPRRRRPGRPADTLADRREIVRKLLPRRQEIPKHYVRAGIRGKIDPRLWEEIKKQEEREHKSIVESESVARYVRAELKKHGYIPPYTLEHVRTWAWGAGDDSASESTE